MREIPSVAGAYLLLVRLAQPLAHGIATLPATTLPAGLYAYCGSAYGPGGLRARVNRHMRKSKAEHWHVDRLTGAGDVVAVALRAGGRECDLVEVMLAANSTVPIRGFGAADCRRCPAHLLRPPEAFDPVAAGLDLISTGRL